MRSLNLLIGAIIFSFSLKNAKAAWGFDEKEANADDSPVRFLSSGDDALIADFYQDAVKYYRHGISLISDTTDVMISLSLHVNLGTALSSLGDDDGAVVSYIAAIAMHDLYSTKQEVSKDERNVAAQAAFFLGMTYQDMENIPPAKAADAYALAASLDSRHWSALANLGSVLHDKIRDYPGAVKSYGAAFAILTERPEDGSEPTDPPPNPRPVLSQLQYRIGLSINLKPDQKCAFDNDPTKVVSCEEVAARAFSLAVKYDESNAAAKHMLATITADATLKRASNTYVTDLFDKYASNFEHSLVDELGYDGFARLRRGFDHAFGGSDNVPIFQTVLDAGCGTGLVGEQFRNISQHLIGVDLSENIIEEAKRTRPNLYDETVVGDVITTLQKAKKKISLIVAADSLIYFGDLEPLFSAMVIGLETDGYLAFTLENASPESQESLSQIRPDWRWQLTASGRFAHRKEYVLFVAKQHFLELLHYESLNGFRHEKGSPVNGHLFIMRKNISQEEL